MPTARLLGAGIALAILPVSCRAVHWARPGATEQDFYRAKRACERSLGPSVCWGSGCIDQAVIRGRQWQDCMRAEGWTSTTTRGLDTSGHAFAPSAAPTSAPAPDPAASTWRLWLTHPETGAPTRPADEQRFSSLPECLGFLDATREIFRTHCPPSSTDPRCTNARLTLAGTRCLPQ